MQRWHILVLAALVTLGSTAGLPALMAQTGEVTEAGQPYDKTRAQLDDLLEDHPGTGQLRVGVGEATLAFRAGAKPGQVGTSAGTSLDDGPYPYTTVAEPGAGWHDEPMAKAFVVERPDGTRLAMVKTDLYLMQHSLHKRVADLVVDRTGIDRAHLLLQGNHDHSHPYANSPSWGLCLFSDCFDLRQWSYMTRQIAKAIVAATDDLQPATIAAAQGPFTAVQRNVIGPACATTMANGTGPQRALALDPAHQTLTKADGSCVRAGFPRSHVDPAFAVIRFDTPEGTPIGAMLSFAMHPESLDGPHGLTSSDFAGMVERALEDHVRQASGATGFIAGFFTGALGDVEPASADQPGKKDWWRETFARTEDMVQRIAPEAISLFNKAASHGTPNGETVIMPPTSDLVVAIDAMQLAPPEDRPWGPDNSYITEQGGWGIKVPSTRSAQETMTAWLTTVRLGDVLIAGFPGEPITDLALNFKSRVDTEAANVYQGYHWPDEPAWVHDRIEANFATDELAPEAGYRIPLMFAMTSDWTGYHVTRWEYENRNHYRESMTSFGPGSADHLVSAFVEQARYLAGTGPEPGQLSATRVADDAALDAQYAAMVAAEGLVVPTYRASIPPNQGPVGTLTAQGATTAPFQQAEVTWIGGSNAVDLPRVELQQLTDQGWETIASSRGHEVTVTMEDAPIHEDPDQANPVRDWHWTAHWEVPWDQADGTYRMVVEGTYRSAEQDPARATFFDPLGADRSYQATGEPFQVEGPGVIPVNDVRQSQAALRFTFEPTFRDSADPALGTPIAGHLVPDDGGDSLPVELTYTDRGWFQLDKAELPSGSYTLEIDQGAWVDPAGNPSQAVSLGLQVG